MEKIETFCKCVDDFTVNVKPEPDAYLFARVYNVDFGNVAINTVKYKLATIYTPRVVPQRCEYNIMKDSKINPIYQVFNLNHYNGYTHPKAKIKVKIKFQPHVPFQTFMEKFIMWFELHTRVQIVCKGFCIAPIVTPDTTRLYFYKSRTNCSLESLVFTNETEVPAIFEFDVDEGQDIFYIQKPTSGEIGGHRKHKVLFKFKPLKYGMYAMQITCLICYHKPIIINVFGIYSETDYSKKELTYNKYPFPKKDVIGYNGFFRNIQEVKTYIPPISLSRYFIHFGLVAYKEEENNFCTETFCLTNHMSNGVRVEWLTDSKIFTINPRNISIPPKESMNFECCFKPINYNKVYKKTLRCQVFWRYDEVPNSTTLPLTECVKVIGHSCLDEDIFNFAKLNIIPSIITLPPCIPLQKVATTFKLENPGKLPVIFKFIPPKNTNVLLKPQVGVIAEQIFIAVQFNTDFEEQKTYIEQWVLILNDNCEKFIPVYIKVECSIPNITIGNDDLVFYQPMQMNTQAEKSLPMYNNTIYKIQFKFNNDNEDFFQSIPQEGILNPYDDTLITFKYKAKNCSKSKFIETVELKIDNQEDLPYNTFVQEFKVSTDKRYSTLFANPSYFEIGIIKCGLPIDATFDLLNWGEATVHYKIYINEIRTFTHQSTPDHFTIDPIKGSLTPNEKHTITLKTIASSVGSNYIQISYINRVDENLDEIANLKVVNLVQLTYICQYPTILFTELVEHNFGKLFSKRQIWDMLNMNKINQHLDSCRVNETKTVDSYLPEMPCTQEEYWIVLIATALTAPKEEVEIKRSKNCDCKLETTSTLTRWIKQYNCPHRLLLSMDLISEEDSETYTCILNIKYLMPQENILSFYINLSESRSILINFHIFTVPFDSHLISTYTRNYDVTLKDVFIGDAEAITQIFWLYNSTDDEVNYFIDTILLNDICSKEGFNVLELVNPEGVIQGQTRFPLLIKFLPIQAKQYKAQIGGLMGEEAIVLRIDGKGTNTKPDITEDTEMFSNLTLRDPVNNKICLSMDFIKLEVFPAWNYVQKMILITNSSKEVVFYYEFESEILANIIDITATSNGYGYLKPKQSQNVIITIKSLGQPVLADFIINCKVTNMCEKYLFDRNMKTYLQRLENGSAKESDHNNMSLTEFENWKGVSPHYLTLQIAVYTIGSKDKDSYLDIDTQLKYVNQTHLNVDINNAVNSIIDSRYGNNFTEMLEFERESKTSAEIQNFEIKSQLFKNTAELLIGNVIFSRLFQGLLKISSKQNPPIFNNYKKFKTICPSSNELKELRMQDAIKLFQKPNISETATTFENMLNDIIKQENNIENASTLEDCFDLIETYVTRHSVCTAKCHCKNKNK